MRICYLCCLVLLLGACRPPLTQNTELPTPPVEGVGPEVYALAAPSVARITASGRVGSGFVVDAGGVILTTAHLVRDALTLDVGFPGWRTTLPARVVGYDESLDLALIEVTLPEDVELMPLDLATLASSPIDAGAEIWTIGHPQGYDWSITQGIVSRTQLDAGELLTSLLASTGNAGAPVLRMREGRVEVVGMLSPVLSRGNAHQSLVVSSDQITSSLDTLLSGAKTGWSDVEGFVGTLDHRSPLVHQLVVANAITVDSSDRLQQIFGNLEVAALPARETLQARTTWRYNYTGQHRFRYQVLRVAESGELEPLHTGPERDFVLEDAEASYVHDVAIDLAFEDPGLYVLTVETEGVLSAAFPFFVLLEGTPPPAAPELPWLAAPIHHAMLLAAVVEKSGEEGPISVSSPFNQVQATRFPHRAQFSTWVRWGFGFEGAHRFQLLLVDGRGAPLAAGHLLDFNVNTAHDSYDHIAEWDVDFPSAGIYYVVCITDGTITRVLPVWVGL